MFNKVLVIQAIFFGGQYWAWMVLHFFSLLEEGIEFAISISNSIPLAFEFSRQNRFKKKKTLDKCVVDIQKEVRIKTNKDHTYLKMKRLDLYRSIPTSSIASPASDNLLLIDPYIWRPVRFMPPSMGTKGYTSKANIPGWP